jgi:hypothetical protein
MRPILVVAGLAVAVALVTGMLLLRSVPVAAPDSVGPAIAGGGGASAASPHGAGEGEGSLSLRRIAALEARIEELLGTVRRLEASLEAGTAPAAAAHAAHPEPQAPAPGEEGGDAAPEDAAAASAATSADAEAARRREEAILERATRIVAALQLSPTERDRLLEIGRAHSAAVDELGKRARLALRPGAWGLTPEERESLRLLQEERKRVDGEGQAALLQFLGPERWQTFRRLENEEGEKERQVSRLVRPW